MYVGIDQSYSGFGITFLYADGNYETHVKKFDPEKSAGVARLELIGSWLGGEIREHESDGIIEHVCMEGYAAGSKFGREKAGELGAVVKLELYMSASRIFPTIVSPGGLKKFILGKGVGGKNEILLGCYKRWAVDFKNDNAADAYGLARLAEAIHTGKTEFAYEREVIAKLTPFTERPL